MQSNVDTIMTPLIISVYYLRVRSIFSGIIDLRINVDALANSLLRRHCEERSDAAISFSNDYESEIAEFIPSL